MKFKNIKSFQLSVEIFLTTGNLLVVCKNRVLLSIGSSKPANIPLLTKLINFLLKLAGYRYWFVPVLSELR